VSAIPLGPIGSGYKPAVLAADGFEFVGGAGMWRVLGEVDLANRDAFDHALRAILAEVPECVLDLRDLEFIGIGELKLIVEHSRVSGTHVRLVHVPAVVRLCWDAGGLTRDAPDVEVV
jgi:anti-anti-sigma regulatory factor